MSVKNSKDAIVNRTRYLPTNVQSVRGLLLLTGFLNIPHQG